MLVSSTRPSATSSLDPHLEVHPHWRVHDTEYRLPSPHFLRPKEDDVGVLLCLEQAKPNPIKPPHDSSLSRPNPEDERDEWPATTQRVAPAKLDEEAPLTFTSLGNPGRAAGISPDLPSARENIIGAWYACP